MLIERASLRRLCRAHALLADDGDASVSAIAREVGISPYHFIRQFDALYGETPHQYRTRVRLERAKQLLARGRSVTETCFEVGFASLGSFSQLFARHVGVAPSAYRRLVQVQTGFTYAGCFSLMCWLPPAAFA